MPVPVIVFGLGPQTKYVLENLALSGEYEALGVIAHTTQQIEAGKVNGVKVKPWDQEQIGIWLERGVRHGIVIHSKNRVKATVVKQIREMGFDLVNAIHPDCTIASSARVGYNVVVNARAVIQPFASIGDGVMVHAGVIVEHDNIIEDFVNLGPGATLAGWVHVKEGAYVYTNTSVIPQMKIGRHAIVGAGSVILEDVPDYAVVVGNPARVVRYLSD